MTPDSSVTCLGLEYFCFEGDDIWISGDAALIEQARRELDRLGLCRGLEIVDGCVIRAKKAYPIYDATYKDGLAAVRRFLEETPNLQLAGRNGMHRYNNQDHAMLSGILAARNAMGADYDLWSVNESSDYHEGEGEDLTGDWRAIQSTQPLVPGKLSNEH